MSGHVFKSVAEVAAAKVTPKLLRVLNSSDSKSGGEKELFVVRKVGKPMLRKAFMKVYSVTSKEEKTVSVSEGVSK